MPNTGTWMRSGMMALVTSVHAVMMARKTMSLILKRRKHLALVFVARLAFFALFFKRRLFGGDLRLYGKRVFDQRGDVGGLMIYFIHIYPPKTAEMRARQGTRGFARGMYKDVHDPLQNASVTPYCDAYTQFYTSRITPLSTL